MSYARSYGGPWKQREIQMTDEIPGLRLFPDDAIKFGIVVDGRHRFCLVSREILNDLSHSNLKGEALQTEFDAHLHLILEKATKAIRGGMAGDPLVLPSALFFPPM